jgi:glutathione S-transferase
MLQALAAYAPGRLDIGHWPELADWYARMLQRPQVRRALADEEPAWLAFMGRLQAAARPAESRS